jgi:hypothetical protein
MQIALYPFFKKGGREIMIEITAFSNAFTGYGR